MVVEATEDRAALVHLCVEVDRGITWDDAVARLKEAQKDTTAASFGTRLDGVRRRTSHSSFYIARAANPITKKRLVMMALHSQSFIPGDSSLSLRTFRPKSGVNQLPLVEVLQKYVRTRA